MSLRASLPNSKLFIFWKISFPRNIYDMKWKSEKIYKSWKRFIVDYATLEPAFVCVHVDFEV